MLKRTALLPVLLVFALALGLFWQVGQLLNVTRWVAHTDQVIGQANQVQRILVELETGLRGYLVNGRDDYLESYRLAERQIEPALASFEGELSEGSEQQEHSRRIRRSYDEWHVAAKKLILAKGRRIQIQGLIPPGEGKRLMDQLRKELDDFVMLEERMRNEKTGRAQRVTRWVIAGSFVLSLLIGAIFASYIWRRLTFLAGEYSSSLSQAESQRDQLRIVIGNAPIILWAVGADGRFILSEGKGLAHLGIASGEIVGKDHLDVLKDEPEQIEHIRRAFAGENFTVQVQVQNRWFDTTFTPVKRKDGTVERIIAVSVDTTERRQAERSLESNERQLRLITNAIPAFVSYMDSEQRYQFGNKTYEEWFGVSMSELRGKKSVEVLGEAVYAHARGAIESALAGQATKYDLDLPKRGVGIRRVQVEYIPDFDSDGHVRGFIGLGHDITDQKEIEKELKRAVRARDEFLSIASHELKTPLTPLKIQIQSLQRLLTQGSVEGLNPEKLLKTSALLDRQISRMTHLIDDLLDVARINAGKFVLVREKVDLAQILQEVAENYASDVLAAKSSLTVEVSEPVIGNWDSIRVEQVVVNLLANALKYGMGKPIVLSLQNGPSAGVIQVKDHGEGIQPEHQVKIFERFEQVGSEDHRRGLGLGLFISKQIVEAHGGSIRVDSQSGVGSTFIVSLPKIGGSS